MSSKEVKLRINGVDIPLDIFVRNYIDKVMNGIVSSLENAGNTHRLRLLIHGEDIEIQRNQAPLALNQFVQRIVKSTVIGMVSTLKGVNQVSTLVMDLTYLE